MDMRYHLLLFTHTWAEMPTSPPTLLQAIRDPGPYVQSKKGPSGFPLPDLGSLGRGDLSVLYHVGSYAPQHLVHCTWLQMSFLFSCFASQSAPYKCNLLRTVREQKGQAVLPSLYQRDPEQGWLRDGGEGLF